MSSAKGGGCYYPLGSSERLGSGGPALAITSKANIDPSRLDRSVGTLQGVGKTTQDKLRALGIASVRDLLMHLPFRHEVPSRFAQVCDLRTDEEVTLRVQVVSCTVRETSRRRREGA